MHEQDLFSKKNWIALSQEVNTAIRNLSRFEKHGRELLNLTLRVIGLIAGFILFGLPGQIWKIIALILISYCYYGITITCIHETSHLSFFKSSKLNKIFSYFFADFWVGQSNLWWHYRHVQEHHNYTNIPGKDEESFIFPWISKYVYFFLAPYLVLGWFLYRSIKHLWNKWSQMAIYLLLTTLGYVLQTLLFSLYVPLNEAIIYMLIARLLFAPVFMHLAVFNHIGLDNPRQMLPWLPHQSRTTRNLKFNWFLAGLGGNAFVECHIEHHLFPGLSNHILDKIHPIVKKYLIKEGYRYVEEGYFFCLKNCLKHYKKLFNSSPVNAF